MQMGYSASGKQSHFVLKPFVRYTLFIIVIESVCDLSY